MSVSASMERGQGGRIVDAFASAKDREEAAFITFMTAGCPTADDTPSILMGMQEGKGVNH